MQEKFYFDTSIWIDYYLKRGKNGETAKKLILKIVKKEDMIIYSDFTIKEFRKLGLFENEINEILRIAKPNNIKRVHIAKEQREEAKKLASKRKVPRGDALHAILARDHEAQLISKDQDFKKLKDIANTKIPEEII